jgi:uncharacterized membrane-anchored protein
MKKIHLLLLSLLTCSWALAQTDEADLLTPEEFEARLNYQRGPIVLGNGLASLNVPAGFRYLGPEDAEKILVQAWGNPPGNETLGMLFPSEISPLSQNGWGVVITYEEDGYVQDDDAGQIDYNDLLEEMKENVKTSNAERIELGYPAVELLGWATPPRYDESTHKLYWAKELKFLGSREDSVNTLNYNIRVLGRRGVLVLNAVSSMRQLVQVEADMQQVLAFVDFNEGHRYADFNPSIDKVAGYGIGTLIAGKVAAKAGLFKMLGSLLVVGKKFIVLLLIGLGVFLKRIFAKMKGDDTKARSGLA